MPSTKEKFSFQRAIVPGLPGAGGEPPGEPPAPPVEGREPRALSQELVDDAVDGAAGRRRLRQALGMPADRRISDEVIDELLAGASTEEEIAGPGGLLAELTKELVSYCTSWC